MKKILYLLKEMFFLIRKQKVYFLAPLLILLAALTILVFYLGPSVIISFIYAGI
jgi:hypothetical protein